MVFLVIVLSVLLAISWGILLLGKKDVLHTRDASRGVTPVSSEAASVAATPVRFDLELEKKKKELEEQRAQLAEYKEQIKQLKRKIYEQKESDKGENDLVKARAEVERKASQQLDATRAELATVTAELEKLKASGAKGKPQVNAVVEVSKPVVAAPVVEVAPVPAPAPAKMVRELTETERERFQRLEVLSSKDRVRIAELERDLKNAKGRAETLSRQTKTGRGETKLVTDKFRALEKRLNRTLLEKDLLFRALADIEKKTGVTADRTQLTQDEVELSDRSIEQMHKAEDKALADAQAKLEVEPAPNALGAAPTGEAAPSPAPVTRA